MDDDDDRARVLHGLGYGLYVATAAGGGTRCGWAATWLMQCSFDPPAVAIAARRDSTRAAAIAAGGVFAVNLMERGQQDLVSRFYAPVEETGPDLAGVAFTLGDTGCPLLDDGLGAIECRVTDSVPGGDHTIFVGDVVAARWLRDGVPLTLRDTGLDYGGLEDTS